ncbi:MAG: MATE family efflux transporter [Thermoplasmatota archaeon]
MGNGKAKLIEGDVRPTLIKLTGPMMLALVSMIAFNLVDTAFIGMLGARELAAMSFTFAPIFLLTSIAIGIGTGGTSVISRIIGEGRTKNVRRLTSDTIVLGLIISVITSIIGIFTIEPIFGLLGAEPDLLPLVRSYMTIWYISLPFVIVPIIGNSIIRSTGDMKTPMYIMFVAIVINFILDPILIFGPGPLPAMGLEGGAWATAIARGFTLPTAVYVLRHKEKMLIFGRPGFRDVLSSWRSILHIGIPAAFVNMLAPVNTAIVTIMVANQGELAVGGFGAASRVEALLIMPQIALGVAIIPFIGQNMGAGRWDRIREGVHFSFKIMTVYGLAAFALMALTAPLTAVLFNTNSVVVDSYVGYLRFAGLGFYMLGIALFVSSAFNGMGRPFPSAVLNVVRLIILQVPFMLAGASLFGLEGIYLGIAIGNAVVGLLSYIWLLKTVKRKGVGFRISKFILPDCQVDNLGSRLFGRPRECSG